MHRARRSESTCQGKLLTGMLSVHDEYLHFKSYLTLCFSDIFLLEGLVVEVEKSQRTDFLAWRPTEWPRVYRKRTMEAFFKKDIAFLNSSTFKSELKNIVLRKRPRVSFITPLLKSLAELCVELSKMEQNVMKIQYSLSNYRHIINDGFWA